MKYRCCLLQKEAGYYSHSEEEILGEKQSVSQAKLKERMTPCKSKGKHGLSLSLSNTSDRVSELGLKVADLNQGAKTLKDS